MQTYLTQIPYNNNYSFGYNVHIKILIALASFAGISLMKLNSSDVGLAELDSNCCTSKTFVTT